MDIASITITGNLCTDPETRCAGQHTLCSFRLAANPRKDNPIFIQVDAWGKQGEVCQDYLSKGARVAVQGTLLMDQWEAQDGTKRSAYKINASQVQFLSLKEKEAPWKEPVPAPPPSKAQNTASGFHRATSM